jgi:hypothetical protein
VWKGEEEQEEANRPKEDCLEVFISLLKRSELFNDMPQLSGGRKGKERKEKRTILDVENKKKHSYQLQVMLMT